MHTRNDITKVTSSLLVGSIKFSVRFFNLNFSVFIILRLFFLGFLVLPITIQTRCGAEEAGGQRQSSSRFEVEMGDKRSKPQRETLTMSVLLFVCISCLIVFAIGFFPLELSNFLVQQLLLRVRQVVFVPSVCECV